MGAHPRLGEKKVDSEQSRAEQAQLNTGGEAEAEKLRALNEEYEKAFPGLRYVSVLDLWTKKAIHSKSFTESL